jgi:hypothetical protein
MEPTWFPPPLLLLLAVATAATATDAPPLSPTLWPDRFHAVLTWLVGA